MKFKLFVLLGLAFLLVLDSSSQDLTREKLTDSLRLKGIKEFYSYYPDYDGYMQLSLYSRNRYYLLINNNFGAFVSYGNWLRKSGRLELINDMVDTSLGVKIIPLDDKSLACHKSLFLVPIDSSGRRYSDSKVFVNNDNDYCFPYFDTCVGNVQTVNRVRVDFGNGFKSRWTQFNGDLGRRYLIIVDAKYNLDLYSKYRKYIYKVSGSKLIWVTEE